VDDGVPPTSPGDRAGRPSGAPILGSVITTTGLELRAGARVLIAEANLRVQPGDRIGLVGRNGAGKTTTLTTLAGERLPHAGKVEVSGEIGYLPQDPRSGDLDTSASDRVLSGRGLDVLRAQMTKAQVAMAEPADDAERDRAVRRYGRLEDQFAALGGYAAESEAARICTALGLPDRVLVQPLRTLSGGQRRRVELARILFSDAETLLLDEPTNHLDADSITWLKSFLASHKGGLIVISHDVELLDAVVNKVWHLDANRATVDVYNLGWKPYLAQRETDERRRRQERANTERKIDALTAQADKMRAKATKARAAQSMDKRAQRLAAGLEDVRVADRVAKLRFPTPAPCGRTPLTAEGLSKSYGSLEVFTDVDLAVDRGARVVVLGLNGAGKTTLLRMLAGAEVPDTGEVKPGHGLRIGYYAQEHETLDHDRSLLENMRAAAPQSTDTELRRILGAFLFTGDAADQRAGTLSGGEKTRLAMATLVVSGANVLLLDEPTNNLDPASREQVLDALRTYAGAIVLVTHDEGAVRALDPDKVILLPDGTEDAWSEDLADLVELA
jgi:ATPase subunit of ABC transporter with duplicated ATPase domains